MCKNIIHIVGDSQFGGGAVLILHLAKKAVLNGCNVSVLSTNCQFQKAIQAEGLNVIDLACIKREINPVLDFLGMIRLFLFLKRNRFDIVHTHTSKAGLIGRISAFLAGVPVVVHTVHGFAFHEQSSKKAVKFYTFIERLAAKFCHKIVTVSYYHRDWA